MEERIGERIKKIRKEKGLTLTELAQQAKVSKGYLSEIERDSTPNPSIGFLNRIATVLGIDVEVLLGGKENEIMDKEWNDIIEDAVSQGVTKQQFKTIIEFLMKLREKEGDG